MSLSVRDLSAILKMPEATVYRLIRDWDLPAREVNGHYRAHPVDFLEWLADHPAPVDPRALPTDGVEGSPRLEAAIRAGGVYHDLPGITRREATAALAARLPGISGLPAADMSELLLRRESLGTAFLKQGLALPSPRHPLIHSSMPSMLIVAFPSNLIAWNGSGFNVRVIFSLVTPTVREHLRLLGRLIFALHDQNFNSRLATRAATDQILAAARALDHVAAGEAETR